MAQAPRLVETQEDRALGSPDPSPQEVCHGEHTFEVGLLSVPTLFPGKWAFWVRISQD